jgi:hypothetical protein
MPNSQLPETAPRFVSGFNEGTLGLFAAVIFLVAAVLWSARSPNVEKTDFSLTYVGARIVHQGLGARLYDSTLQKQLRDSLFAHPNPLLFEHPPFEALLFSPLATLPFRTAYMSWGLFNAAVWLALIWFLRPYLPTPHEELGYLSLWLLFAPMMVALYQGQPSLLLLAVYALTFTSLKRKREFIAGVYLGLGLFRFQFVLPFVFVFLLLRKWRLLAGFSLAAIFWGLLSLVAVGWTGMVSYVRFLWSIGNNPQNLSYGSGVDMPTIHGFVYAILGNAIGHMGLNITVGLLSVGLLIFVAVRWESLRGGTSSRAGLSFDLMFAAGVAASLLSGSHMFTHDFSPLALAMFLAAAGFSNSGATGHRALRITMRVTLVLFWFFPIYFLFVAWHCLYLMCPVLLMFAFSALLGAKYLGQQPQAEIERVITG